MKIYQMILSFIFSIMMLFHTSGLANEIRGKSQSVSPNPPPVAKITGPLSYQECIDIALQNNRYRTASRFAIEIAEAQYQQALSAYWPQLGIKSTYSVMDQDPNFIFPATKINVPATTLVVSTPFGPLPVTMPPQSMPIPEQDIKVMDRQNLLSSVQLTYPIYTGGLQGAIVKQASKGLQIAKEEAKRTDLQLV